MTDRKTYYHSPVERPTRGTDEQGADMFERQQTQRKKQEKEIREHALEIDPDNYTPSRD